MSKTAWSEYKLAIMSRRRLRFGPTLLLTLAAAAVGAPAGAQTAADAGPAGAGPTVNAVWTEHEFTFTYFGRGTYYSCGGLENKIAYILTELGARPEPWVRVSCLDGTGVQLMPTARIRVAVPAAVTPELLAQLEAEKPKRELISKAQGKGAEVVDDAEALGVEHGAARGRDNGAGFGLNRRLPSGAAQGRDGMEQGALLARGGVDADRP